MSLRQESQSGDLVKEWSIMVCIEEQWPFPKKRCVIAGKYLSDHGTVTISAKKPEKVMSRRQLTIIPSSEQCTPLTVPTKSIHQ